MMGLFNNYTEQIKKEITAYFHAKSKELQKVNRWSTDSIKRLTAYTTSGKMLRGGLILLVFDLYKKPITKSAVQLAVAVELFHSSLLIHDDIMDNDHKRRGHEAIHYQYRQFAAKNNFQNNTSFGNNMGICVGDICIFFATEIISSLKIPAHIKSRLINICSKEYTNVGLAQMQDLFFTESTKIPDQEEIFKLYLYKTARYTFALPFLLGGLLISLPQQELLYLQSIGEALGILFQIRDDELGLFGNENRFGKPIGSDIEEGKKTLLFILLLQQVTANDREQLLSIYGSANISTDTLAFIKNLFHKHNVNSIMNNIIKTYISTALHNIEQLTISDNNKKKLNQLVSYNQNRDN